MKRRISKLIEDAAYADRIVPTNHGYQFRVTGNHGNSVSAYSLWAAIQKHCKSRHVSCKLLRDGYQGLKPGFIRTGCLWVEIMDPLANEIEGVIRRRDEERAESEKKRAMAHVGR